MSATVEKVWNHLRDPVKHSQFKDQRLNILASAFLKASSLNRTQQLLQYFKKIASLKNISSVLSQILRISTKKR